MFLWGIALLSLFVWGGYARFSNGEKEDLTEVTVEKGAIEEVVRTSGVVIAEKNRFLSFPSSGIVENIYFSEGELVKEGDVIATLETDILQAQLKAAQAEVEAAKLNLTRSQNLSKIDIQKENVKVSQIDLSTLEESLVVQKEINSRDEKIAEVNLDTEEEIYEDLKEQKEFLVDEQKQKDDVNEANEEVQEKVSSEAEELAEEQSDLSTIQSEWGIDNINNQIDIQTNSKDVGELALETTKLKNKDEEETLNANLKKLDSSLKQQELTLNDTVLNFETDIEYNQNQLKKALANLEIARYNLNRAKMIAPFDATILTLPFKQGENFAITGSGNTIVEIANLDSYLVQLSVNEIDVISLKPGQDVTIEFDAIYDMSVDGTVRKIYPKHREVDGVVEYNVDVSFEKPEGIYLGMSANASIITKSKQDALTVPLIAVEFKNNGEYVKVKTTENEYQERQVRVGIQSGTNIEIIDGVKTGDTILY